MFAEMEGKGGTLCGQAKNGKIRCPLIVRPNSEDVITDELFSRLKVIRSRWWLSDILARGIDPVYAKQTLHRQLRVALWQRQPRFPSAHLPWREGSTEVDVVITWENPATTMFIEMKYGAGISKSTTNHSDASGYPNDQIIRNIRVGLWRTGHLESDKLFQYPTRRFLFLLCTPGPGEPVVEKYRDVKTLDQSIPKIGMRLAIPTSPFIGQIAFSELCDVLLANRRFMTCAEQSLTDDIAGYLQRKTELLHSIPANKSNTKRTARQIEIQNCDP